MGMMKGNMAMMIPQTLIMGWINAFFAGFVVRTSSLLLPHAFRPFELARTSGRWQGCALTFARDNSQTPLSIDPPLQINAAIRRRHA